jgi:hypothetical protein
MEIALRAAAQAPGPDGVRRTRFAVIRNTMPMLRDTTIKTFLDWFPPDVAGEWRQTDKTFIIKADGIHCEVLFRALDEADDVAKLLSLELTGAYINECREIKQEIVEGLMKRIGRYPSKKDGVGCTWYGIWADTNPPEYDSWWYRMMEKVDGENGWSVYKQPSGRSPFAENIENLPDDYYATTGLSEEYIRVYIDGEYGTSRSGRPVYEKTFKRSYHVAEQEMRPVKTATLVIGLDFGRTPSAVFGQLMPDGVMCIYDEVLGENIGLERYLETMLKPKLASKEYAGMRTLVIGDPAGVAKQQGNDMSMFDILRKAGLAAYPAPSNDPDVRVMAVEHYLSQQVLGKPAFLINPRCKTLIQGFEYGYRFKENKNGTLTGLIDKNAFSHPHDALQYLALGIKSNYIARVTRTASSVGRTIIDGTGWT